MTKERKREMGGAPLNFLVFLILLRRFCFLIFILATASPQAGSCSADATIRTDATSPGSACGVVVVGVADVDVAKDGDEDDDVEDEAGGEAVGELKVGTRPSLAPAL
jgi:hypothetical protein